jgi:hypothetical protein
MFSSNPFDFLAGSFITNDVMQAYLILMVIFVAGGTILHVAKKQSARYFSEMAAMHRSNAKRSVGAGEKMGIAAGILVNEVALAGEFCNKERQASHFLSMWGFILYCIGNVVLIFGDATSAMGANLWHWGALMLVVGGAWFWFRIRVDVSAEGTKWYKLVEADIFIVSLMLTALFGLIWSSQAAGQTLGMNVATLFFVLFAISNTVLFGSVFWSKFSHMFFKPAAAYQKKVSKADGSNLNLPAEYDLADPATHARYPDLPLYMGTNPPNMGKGIRARAAKNY